MIQKIRTYLFIALTVLAVGSNIAAADEQQVVDLTPYWDSAVSSLLLAAGMYGANDERADNERQGSMQLSLTQSDDLYKAFTSDHTSLSGQDITLSYSGSTGRLGISAGYLYTGLDESSQHESFLLDLNPLQDSLDNENPWYFTLNMSKSFQVSDHFAVGLGSKAMVMNTQFAEPPSHTVSMLLNLPLSYKDFFTITPELQWSRSLPMADSSAEFDETSSGSVYSEEDVFYGGMSISFSY